MLREGILGGPSSPTPLTAQTQADRDLVALLFRGLVRPGDDGRPVADLAASWSVDKKGARWTFVLRADASWQDGVPVTSDDVVYTVHALQDPAYSGPLAADWQGVTVTALDVRTVRFDLADPLAGFLQAATQPLLPAHLLRDVPIANLGSSDFARSPIGDGVFALATLSADGATLVPVAPAYKPGSGPLATIGPGSVAAGVPLVARLELHFYGSPESLAAGFRAGQIDAASGLAPADAMALATSVAESRAIHYPGTTLAAVVLNQRPGQYAFLDPRARRGLLAAIDRAALIADVLAGAGARADTPIPPSSWVYDPKAAPPVAFDRKAAQDGLRAAGWRRTTGGWILPRAKAVTTLELLAPAADVNPVVNATAKEVAADWKAIGLSVKVVELAAGDFVDRLRGGKFTAAVVGVGVGLDPDPYPLLASTQVQTGGSNVSGFQDAGLDKALSAARMPGTDAARRTAYSKLQKTLGLLEPVLPLFFGDIVTVASAHLQGPTSRPLADPSGRFSDVVTWRVVGR